MAAAAVTGQATGNVEGATTRAAKNGATGGALAGGGAIGIPVASIVVYVFKLFGVDLGPIEVALAGVITLAFAAVSARYGAKWAGTAVPTDQAKIVIREDTSEQELAREAAVAAGVAPEALVPAEGGTAAAGSTAAGSTAAGAGTASEVVSADEIDDTGRPVVVVD